jgi:hypothetical protein
MALVSAPFALTACRSPGPNAASGGGSLSSDPCVAAEHFFKSHYDFYYEDPSRCEALLTPRLFRALKQQYDSFERTRQIGALDCDPWTSAQDGEISQPCRFTTLKVRESEAVVRFQHMFVLGPESRTAQSVLMTFQRPSAGAAWQVSDLIMANGGSLVALLEGNP